jgi:NADP-dependent 3-hydroxy acid dehydrogenase YdfG
VDTDFAAMISDPTERTAIERSKQELAIGPDAIARAIAFAIEQPANVEIGRIVVRPTAQD